MLLSIPLLPVLSSPRVTSTTSVTSDTVTRPFSIARPTPPLGSYPANLTLKRPPMMRRSALKKMSTGPLLIQSRRTASAADAAATPTSWMLKASKAAVFQNGLRWRVAGPHHKPDHFGRSPYCLSIPASSCLFYFSYEQLLRLALGVIC